MISRTNGTQEFSAYFIRFLSLILHWHTCTVRVFVWKSVCLVVCFINRAKWKNEHLFVKNYLNDFAWCGKNALNREKLGDLCAEKRQTKFRYGHGSLIVLDWYGYDDGIDFFLLKWDFSELYTSTLSGMRNN